VCLVSVSKNVTCVYGRAHQKYHLSTWSLTKNLPVYLVTHQKMSHEYLVTHQKFTCVPGHSQKMSPEYPITHEKCHLCTWSLSPKMSPVYLVTVTINNQFHRNKLHWYSLYCYVQSFGHKTKESETRGPRATCSSPVYFIRLRPMQFQMQNTAVRCPLFCSSELIASQTLTL